MVVAGVGVLAHVLHDEVGALRLAVYVVLFLAFWLSWTCFMLYGNTAGGRTRAIRLLIGMFGLAVMAASVPGIAEDVFAEGLRGDQALICLSHLGYEWQQERLANPREPRTAPGAAQ